MRGKQPRRFGLGRWAVGRLALPSWRAAVLCLLGPGLIAGCTSGFVYNRLDTVARWYIGNLVTLDDSQQAALRDWLGRTLVWHRSSELKRYETFVRDLSGEVAKGPDPALPARSARQAEGFFEELASRLAPEAGQLLASLNAAQRDEFFLNLKERDDEELKEEEDRTEADRQKRRTRSLARQLERWTGTSTAEQKEIIARTVASMSAAGLLGEDAAWHESQQAWRGELRAALEAGDATAVEDLLRNPSRSHSEAYLAEEAAERQHFLDLVSELDATLSGKQRATLARKLVDLAEDLKALQTG